jgi:hypothetical protein
MNQNMTHKITSLDIDAHGSLKNCHAIPIYLREDKTNAITHNAKNMYIFQVQRLDPFGPYNYLATATDADPFGYHPNHGWYNDTIDEITQAHMLRSGRTGKQGSGKIASSICISQASAGIFHYENFNLITYSNDRHSKGVVVSTFMEIEDPNVNIYKLRSEVREDMLPAIKEIIENFKFKSGREVTVLHLVRCGSVKSEFPLNINNLNAFNEFCLPTMKDELNVQCCFRSDKSGSNMNKIFNKQPGTDNVTNRVSDGACVELFEKMYSIYSVEEKEMKVNYDFHSNGKKFKVSATVDIKFALFPGIKFVKEEKEEIQKESNGRNLVTLRNTDRRKAGAKGGHDLADSGHRILLSMDSYNEKSQNFERPNGEVIFTVHDSCSNHPYNYTDKYLGFRPTTKFIYKDCKDFLENCKKLEKEKGYNFGIDYNSIVKDPDIESSWKGYSRSPFVKIYINCKSSEVEVIYEDHKIKTTLLGEARINNCFYASPDNDRMQEFIKNSFNVFAETAQYLSLAEIHKLMFPNVIDEKINTVPIKLIYGEAEKVEKIIVMIEKEKENE